MVYQSLSLNYYNSVNYKSSHNNDVDIQPDSFNNYENGLDRINSKYESKIGKIQLMGAASMGALGIGSLALGLRMRSKAVAAAAYLPILAGSWYLGQGLCNTWHGASLAKRSTPDEKTDNALFSTTA